MTWLPRDRLAHGAAVATPPETPAYGTSPDSTGTNRSRWIIGVIIAVIAVAALLWARHVMAPKIPVAALAQQGQLPLVSVIAPGVKSVKSTVSFNGTIHARYDMPISPEGESGRVIAVMVEAGDRVKRGQLLARLDESVLRPQLNRLAASLEESKAQASLSAAEYRRAQGVEAAGALSAEEIARRQAAAVTDQAKVKVAAAMLAEQAARLAKTQIRAPSDGIVLTRSAEVGQTASPGGEPLFRLARDGEMEMRGQVAERDLAALSMDQGAQIYLTGIAKPFQGKVRLLGAIIDPQTRLGDIRISLAPSPLIRPGAFAQGEVIVSTAQRPVLPQTAVLSDAAGTYVLVVGDDSKAKRRAVRVSDTTAEGLVISEGLIGNERVITTAGAFLRAGEQVKVVEAKPEQS
ncbi:MAG: efflux RND transporter periplasmic adaptor subunit [Gammaproteobacteria bacterium]